MAGLKNLKKRRRVQVIVLAFVALAISTGLIGYALKDGINYYFSPTQIVEEPPAIDEIIRVGGLVVEGTIVPDEGVRFYFSVTDGGAVIPVHYIGNDPRPDLFDEGQGTVATGKYDGSIFLATNILAKHDETYMPKEVVDSLKEQGVWEGDGES